MGTRARSAEREQMLGDVITTAVEGGTGYWAQVSQYQWVDTLDGGAVRVVAGAQQGEETRATLHELDDDETGYKDEELELTYDVVAAGIGKIKRGDVGVNGTLKEAILLADRENDAGYIDADGADVIVQAALLGEVRYG